MRYYTNINDIISEIDIIKYYGTKNWNNHLGINENEIAPILDESSLKNNPKRILNHLNRLSNCIALQGRIGPGQFYIMHEKTICFILESIPGDISKIGGFAQTAKFYPKSLINDDYYYTMGTSIIKNNDIEDFVICGRIFDGNSEINYTTPETQFSTMRISPPASSLWISLYRSRSIDKILL